MHHDSYRAVLYLGGHWVTWSKTGAVYILLITDKCSYLQGAPRCKRILSNAYSTLPVPSSQTTQSYTCDSPLNYQTCAFSIFHLFCKLITTFIMKCCDICRNITNINDAVSVTIMGLAASKQEAFWEACGFGHKMRVRKFIDDGIDVNWVSYTVSRVWKWVLSNFDNLGSVGWYSETCV